MDWDPIMLQKVKSITKIPLGFSDHPFYPGKGCHDDNAVQQGETRLC